MVLVTGAAGKTGQAIVRAAAAQGIMVRAALHHADDAARLLALGASETVVVDLLNRPSLERACDGVDALYHICPNVHPNEVEIGANLLAAAQSAGVGHFFFHSVLHPHIEAMPHHWRKMRVEEMLLQSGMPCTILQPTAYIQNLPANLRIDENGVRLVVPYSVQACISLVDLEDVAAVAALLMTQERQSGGIYPLVGTDALSQIEVAETIGRVLGREVVAEEISVDEWKQKSMRLEAQRKDALVRMFAYYNAHGLSGSSRTLALLVGRAPSTLEAVLRRLLTELE